MKDMVVKLYGSIIYFLIIILSIQYGLAMENNRFRFQTEIELGPVWQTRNDVQIPNTQDGTRFSLVDLVGKGPYPAGRPSSRPPYPPIQSQSPRRAPR